MYSELYVQFAMFIGSLVGYSMCWIINRLPVVLHEKRMFGRVLKRDEVAYMREDGCWVIEKDFSFKS